MTPRLWQVLRVAAYVGLGLMALHFVRTMGGTDGADQWAAGGQIEHQTVQKLLVRHAAYLRQIATARKRFTDSLDALLIIIKTQQAAGADLLAGARTAEQFKTAGEVIARNAQVCYDGLTLCTQRGDSLARADSVHTDSLRVALSRMDSTLAVGLTVTRCKFLLVFGCMSRTHALELGLGLGIVSTLVLRPR